jgi:hypothetical protein
LKARDGSLVARNARNKHSPAYKAGLKEYDIFIRAGTPLTPVTGRDALVKAMHDYATFGTGIFE